MWTFVRTCWHLQNRNLKEGNHKGTRFDLIFYIYKEFMMSNKMSSCVYCDQAVS